MTSRNEGGSPCVMCPVRASTFCGTLLNRIVGNAELSEGFHNQVHDGARALENVFRRGEVVNEVGILCQGWAFRSIRLPDGRRQILSILLPGDLFSASMVFEDKINYSIDALTGIRFSRFNRGHVRSTAINSPDIIESLANFCIEEKTALEELATDLGRRNAEERISRMMLSLMSRLERRQVIRECRYPFPLRQQHIADYTGLTPVHVGRVLRAFRKERIIDLLQDTLTVFNRSKLERIAG